MKLTHVRFRDAVQCLDSDRTVPAFSSCEGAGPGYGYELNDGADGVTAHHAKAPGLARTIPWSNIKWVDHDAERPTVANCPPPSDAAPPKGKGWPKGKKRGPRNPIDANAAAIQAAAHIPHD